MFNSKLLKKRVHKITNTHMQNMFLLLLLLLLTIMLTKIPNFYYAYLNQVSTEAE